MVVLGGTAEQYKKQCYLDTNMLFTVVFTLQPLHYDSLIEWVGIKQKVECLMFSFKIQC